MMRRVSKALAALVGTAALALVLTGSLAAASGDGLATVEIVNQTGEAVSFVALVADGQGLKEDTPNLLTTALAPKSGVLVPSVAPGAYRLAGSAFTSEPVVLAAGDVVTLALTSAGKGVQVAAKPADAGAALPYAKLIGQQLPPKQ